MNNVLFLSLPYCNHPGTPGIDDDFQVKSTYRPIPSLALPTLCAFVERHASRKYTIQAIDLNLAGYTEPDMPIVESVYSDALLNAISGTHYDVLAISAPFIYSHRWLKDAVAYSRKYNPESRIIVGGGFATIYPDRILSEYGADAVIIGEGEFAFLQALDDFPNIQGVYRSDRFIDMTETPIPAWDYLEIEQYFEKSGSKMIPIEASRGCPFSCSYCNTSISWGSKVRYKTPANLVKEIEWLCARYDTPTLHFVDDNISFEKAWIVDFLSRLIASTASPALSFSNFSVKRLDNDILDLLFDAGTSIIPIAIESGSERIREELHKPFYYEKTVSIIEYIKSKGKQVHILWMAGFPGETLAELGMTFDLARKLGAHKNQFAITIPYPGTELYRNAKADGFLLSDDMDLDAFDNRKGNFFKSDAWTYPELRNMVYDVNIELNFLKNPNLKTVSGRAFLKRFLKGLVIQLPEHIIAHVLLGYLGEEEHFPIALGLLNCNHVMSTFERFMSWDVPPIREFKAWIETNAVWDGAWIQQGKVENFS